MSERYPGGLITKTPVTPSGPYETSTASGIWTLEEQAYWRKLNQWPIAGSPVPDPQFNYVTMLLHGDGTNGAQNNTFLDSSTNNFTITRNGNTTQGSFSPYGSNWSNYFDGNGDYLLFADNAGLEIGTNSFTFEAWIYLTAYSSAYGSPAEYVATVGAKEGTNGSVSYRLVIVGTASSYTSLVWNTYSNDSTRVITSASYTFALNTWYHVAAVRNGTTVTLYVNGTSIGSGTDATNSQNTSAPFRVGSIGYTNYEYYFPGYISNLRLVNGTAVYTSNFTPPTAPLTAITNTAILTCQSNRFIDNSTNNAAVTVYGNSSVQRFNPFGASTAYSTSVIGGSGYFDGSGDYLSVADSASLELGSSDFCIEGWYFPQSFSANLALVSKRANTTSTGAVVIYANSGSGALTFYASTNGSSYFWSGTTVGTMVLNQWNHFAVYRSGNNWYGAMNGVVSSMGSSANSIYNNSDAWTIGGDTNGNYANGYIASSRIVIGSAVYGASNFTPPTSPLTAITNTSLLLAYTNGAIFDNAMMNDLETVGNAQISTSVVKYGTGSLKFDGTGDYLFVPTNQNMNFGTGNFTIEMWIYPVNVSSIPYLIDGRSTSTASENVVTLYVDSSQYLTYWVNGSARITASSTVSLNTWSHVAVVKNSGTTTMYLNGTSVGTWTDGTTYIASNYLIGQRTSTSSQSWNGYIDDLRITKGYARYTTTFTPPTAAFPDIGPT